MTNQVIAIRTLMDESGVQFGTSGVRGLVSAMTDQVCWTYVTAFIQYLKDKQQIKMGDRFALAGDLRNSTPRIMAAAAQAIHDQGLVPINCGHIPSPAIALYGLQQSIPTLMVTGSHIPDDRNGIKFNKADGEILKADEVSIRQQQVDVDLERFDESGQFVKQPQLPEVTAEAEQQYIARFTAFFSPSCLTGKRIGLYEHSSVSRDCLKTILVALGADVVSLGRSEHFVAVDTEAIRAEDVALAQQWASERAFDCIISTDGDGDRPLVSDEHGQWLRGDIVGLLCAHYLSADAVVTPVSSNTAVDKSGYFERVARTRIGSPYVIEAMQTLLSEHNAVVGYEANGGFLQASTISLEGKILAPLPTRDAIIVPLALLALSAQKNKPLSKLVADLPSRYTASDRLKNFPTELSQSILTAFNTGDVEQDFVEISRRFPALDSPVQIDRTDGVRLTFANADIVHLRPSGNAPELRCYTESDTEASALALNSQCIAVMQTWLS